MTKTQLIKFKKEFATWQTRLGLTEYTIEFVLRKLEGEWASFAIDATGCVGKLTLTSAHKWTLQNIRETACHECLHLLLARLSERGAERFVEETELSNENERIVCVLEKVLCPARKK